VSPISWGDIDWYNLGRQMPIQFIDGVECVDCPCCKGRGWLEVTHEDTGWEYKTTCCHCMGKRYIEVERPNEQR